MIDVDNIRLVSIEEIYKLLDMEKDVSISLPLIKEACKLLKITYFGGGTTFFDLAKYPPGTTELDGLVNHVLESLPRMSHKMILYSKEFRKNTPLSYYHVIAFSGNDLADLKKIIKVNKLKAFL